MATARRPLRAALVLCAASIVAAGCGGGEATDTGAVAPPAGDPNAPAPGTVVGQPGATDPATGQPVATDPTTGQPLDPAAAGTDSGTTATVPDLVGDDVVGGLQPVANTPLFDARAVETIEKPTLDTSTDFGSGTDGGFGTGIGGSVTETQQEKVTYTGAKIYVDGITHDVKVNGTFPKGNPVFRLLSVTANEIEVDLVAGEFTSSGGTGTFLDKGDLVSMVNASEQLTYRVKFLRPVASSSDISF